MRRILLLALLFIAIGGTTEVYSQSWIKKLGKKVEEKAKQKVEEKAEKAVDKAFDKAEDAATDAVTGKGKDKKNTSNDDVSGQDAGDGAMQDNGTVKPQKGQSLEMTYAKSDFVPGDEIIFDDPMDSEQMGEFPSQWDLLDGTAEVASLNGKKCLYFDIENAGKVAPLMKDMVSYLPDEFTLELDFLSNPQYDSYDGCKTDGYNVIFRDASGREVMDLGIGHTSFENKKSISWSYYAATGGDRRRGETDITMPKNESWVHLSISFNKRAFKAYINGSRFVNIPNMAAPARVEIKGRTWGTACQFNEAITNVRIAKGAVPLYDRMMSEGKFITYGITFDVGKSTIKPESMGEINRIVQLMNENPDLKFSVEGHTDNTGSAAGNQTLSEARSQAIVAKLVEMGISADRLTASGKGQSSPIADNSTDEGRAKNRRVEFVKQ